MCRYERKFQALDVSIAQIELIVKLHAAHFRQVYPPRMVNNVYFDTPALSDYARHVNGSSDRSKLRVRWYGSRDGQIGQSTLELKTRRGLVGAKTSFALNGFTHNGHIDQPRLLEALRAGRCDPTVVERLARSLAALFNRYHRRYYVSADNRFRLTIDTHLSFRAVPGRRFACRDRYDERRLIVIELKYGVGLDSNAHFICHSLPFRLGKLSKYVHGIQRLAGRY